ncbi:MAG: DNA polymerase III subunit delta, partial [Acidiferrobacterales bacterium]|nr:DNA polymerase III subunit delta [Acidiferrobacterales bacterium]
MRVAHQDLQSVLEKQLASVYVVYGEETLLAEEACNSIRAAARNNGFDDRELMVVERGFDWERLNQEGESLSLFSQKRLLELRIPGSKPGDQGSKAMTRYCENVPEDTLLLVWCGKLDRAQLNSKWFKALDSTGVSVGVQPVSAQQMPNWIAQRLKKHGLEPGPGVPELLAYRYEGNLLAAAQEAEKLALLFEGSVSAE